MTLSEKTEKISSLHEFANESEPNYEQRVFTSMDQLIANKQNPTPMLLLGSNLNTVQIRNLIKIDIG